MNQSAQTNNNDNINMSDTQADILCLIYYVNKVGDITQAFFKPTAQGSAASVRLQVLPALKACINLNNQINIQSLHSEQPCFISYLGKYKACLVGKLSAHTPHLIENMAVANLAAITKIKLGGTPIVVLYCDHHMAKKGVHGYFYKNLLQLADYIIYPSKYLQREGDKAASKSLLKSFLIPDPWQINVLHRPRLKRRDESWKLIWFGSNSNLKYLLHALFEISSSSSSKIDIELTILCTKWGIEKINKFNQSGLFPTGWALRCIEWNPNNQPTQLEEELIRSHIAMIPSNPQDPTKAGVSHNRIVDSIRAGCLTIASPMESYEELSKICLLGDKFSYLIASACSDYKRLSTKHSLLGEKLLEKFSPEKNLEGWIAIWKEILQDTTT